MYYSRTDVDTAIEGIGSAFDGLTRVTQHGSREPLSASIRRFYQQHTVPMRLGTIVQIAERINELRADNERLLAALAAAESGWGDGPVDDGSAVVETLPSRTPMSIIERRLADLES